MNNQLLVSASFLLVSVSLLAVYPDFPLAITTSIGAVLFGFLNWLERKKLDSISNLESQIKVIKDKVEVLQMQKGFGR